MIDWNKPLRMKDGTLVNRVLCTDRVSKKGYTHVITYIDEYGDEITTARNVNGLYDINFSSYRDLENTPEKVYTAVFLMVDERGKTFNTVVYDSIEGKSYRSTREELQEDVDKYIRKWSQSYKEVRLLQIVEFEV